MPLLTECPGLSEAPEMCVQLAWCRYELCVPCALAALLPDFKSPHHTPRSLVLPIITQAFQDPSLYITPARRKQARIACEDLLTRLLTLAVAPALPQVLSTHNRSTYVTLPSPAPSSNPTAALEETTCTLLSALLRTGEDWSDFLSLASAKMKWFIKMAIRQTPQVFVTLPLSHLFLFLINTVIDICRGPTSTNPQATVAKAMLNSAMYTGPAMTMVKPTYPAPRSRDSDSWDECEWKKESYREWLCRTSQGATVEVTKGEGKEELTQAANTSEHRSSRVGMLTETMIITEMQGKNKNEVIRNMRGKRVSSEAEEDEERAIDGSVRRWHVPIGKKRPRPDNDENNDETEEGAPMSTTMISERPRITKVKTDSSLLGPPVAPGSHMQQVALGKVVLNQQTARGGGFLFNKKRRLEEGADSTSGFPTPAHMSRPSLVHTEKSMTCTYLYDYHKPYPLLSPEELSTLSQVISVGIAAQDVSTVVGYTSLLSSSLLLSAQQSGVGLWLVKGRQQCAVSSQRKPSLPNGHESNHLDCPCTICCAPVYSEGLSVLCAMGDPGAVESTSGELTMSSQPLGSTFGVIGDNVGLSMSDENNEDMAQASTSSPQRTTSFRREECPSMSNLDVVFVLALRQNGDNNARLAILKCMTVLNSIATSEQGQQLWPRWSCVSNQASLQMPSPSSSPWLLPSGMCLTNSAGTSHLIPTLLDKWEVKKVQGSLYRVRTSKARQWSLPNGRDISDIDRPPSFDFLAKSVLLGEHSTIASNISTSPPLQQQPPVSMARATQSQLLGGTNDTAPSSSIGSRNEDESNAHCHRALLTLLSSALRPLLASPDKQLQHWALAFLSASISIGYINKDLSSFVLYEPLTGTSRPEGVTCTHAIMTKESPATSQPSKGSASRLRDAWLRVLIETNIPEHLMMTLPQQWKTDWEREGKISKVDTTPSKGNVEGIPIHATALRLQTACLRVIVEGITQWSGEDTKEDKSLGRIRRLLRPLCSMTRTIVSQVNEAVLLASQIEAACATDSSSLGSGKQGVVRGKSASPCANAALDLLCCIASCASMEMRGHGDHLSHGPQNENSSRGGGGDEGENEKRVVQLLCQDILIDAVLGKSATVKEKGADVNKPKALGFLTASAPSVTAVNRDNGVRPISAGSRPGGTAGTSAGTKISSGETGNRPKSGWDLKGRQTRRPEVDASTRGHESPVKGGLLGFEHVSHLLHSHLTASDSHNEESKGGEVVALLHAVQSCAQVLGARLLKTWNVGHDGQGRQNGDGNVNLKSTIEWLSGMMGVLGRWLDDAQMIVNEADPGQDVGRDDNQMTREEERKLSTGGGDVDMTYRREGGVGDQLRNDELENTEEKTCGLNVWMTDDNVEEECHGESHHGLGTVNEERYKGHVSPIKDTNSDSDICEVNDREAGVAVGLNTLGTKCCLNLQPKTRPHLLALLPLVQRAYGIALSQLHHFIKVVLTCIKDSNHTTTTSNLDNLTSSILSTLPASLRSIVTALTGLVTSTYLGDNTIMNNHPVTLMRMILHITQAKDNWSDPSLHSDHSSVGSVPAIDPSSTEPTPTSLAVREELSVNTLPLATQWNELSQALFSVSSQCLKTINSLHRDKIKMKGGSRTGTIDDSSREDNLSASPVEDLMVMLTALWTELYLMQTARGGMSSTGYLGSQDMGGSGNDSSGLWADYCDHVKHPEPLLPIALTSLHQQFNEVVNDPRNPYHPYITGPLVKEQNRATQIFWLLLSTLRLSGTITPASILMPFSTALTLPASCVREKDHDTASLTGQMSHQVSPPPVPQCSDNRSSKVFKGNSFAPSGFCLVPGFDTSCLLAALAAVSQEDVTVGGAYRRNIGSGKIRPHDSASEGSPPVDRVRHENLDNGTVNIEEWGIVSKRYCETAVLGIDLAVWLITERTKHVQGLVDKVLIGEEKGVEGSQAGLYVGGGKGGFDGNVSRIDGYKDTYVDENEQPQSDVEAFGVYQRKLLVSSEVDRATQWKQGKTANITVLNRLHLAVEEGSAEMIQALDVLTQALSLCSHPVYFTNRQTYTTGSGSGTPVAVSLAPIALLAPSTSLTLVSHCINAFSQCEITTNIYQKVALLLDGLPEKARDKRGAMAQEGQNWRGNLESGELRVTIKLIQRVRQDEGRKRRLNSLEGAIALALSEACSGCMAGRSHGREGGSVMLHLQSACALRSYHAIIYCLLHYRHVWKWLWSRPSSQLGHMMMSSFKEEEAGSSAVGSWLGDAGISSHFGGFNMPSLSRLAERQICTAKEQVLTAVIDAVYRCVECTPSTGTCASDDTNLFVLPNLVADISVSTPTEADSNVTSTTTSTSALNGSNPQPSVNHLLPIILSTLTAVTRASVASSSPAQKVVVQRPHEVTGKVTGAPTIDQLEEPTRPTQEDSLGLTETTVLPYEVAIWAMDSGFDAQIPPVSLASSHLVILLNELQGLITQKYPPEPCSRPPPMTASTSPSLALSSQSRDFIIPARTIPAFILTARSAISTLREYADAVLHAEERCKQRMEVVKRLSENQDGVCQDDCTMSNALNSLEEAISQLTSLHQTKQRALRHLVTAIHCVDTCMRSLTSKKDTWASPSSPSLPPTTAYPPVTQLATLLLDLRWPDIICSAIPFAEHASASSFLPSYNASTIHQYQSAHFPLLTEALALRISASQSLASSTDLSSLQPSSAPVCLDPPSLSSSLLHSSILRSLSWLYGYISTSDALRANMSYLSPSPSRAPSDSPQDASASPTASVDETSSTASSSSQTSGYTLTLKDSPSSSSTSMTSFRLAVFTAFAAESIEAAVEKIRRGGEKMSLIKERYVAECEMTIKRYKDDLLKLRNGITKTANTDIREGTQTGQVGGMTESTPKRADSADPASTVESTDVSTHSENVTRTVGSEETRPRRRGRDRARMRRWLEIQEQEESKEAGMTEHGLVESGEPVPNQAVIASVDHSQSDRIEHTEGLVDNEGESVRAEGLALTQDSNREASVISSQSEHHGDGSHDHGENRDPRVRRGRGRPRGSGRARGGRIGGRVSQTTRDSDGREGEGKDGIVDVSAAPSSQPVGGDERRSTTSGSPTRRADVPEPEALPERESPFRLVSRSAGDGTFAGGVEANVALLTVPEMERSQSNGTRRNDDGKSNSGSDAQGADEEAKEGREGGQDEERGVTSVPSHIGALNTSTGALIGENVPGAEEHRSAMESGATSHRLREGETVSRSQGGLEGDAARSGQESTTHPLGHAINNRNPPTTTQSNAEAEVTANAATLVASSSTISSSPVLNSAPATTTPLPTHSSPSSALLNPGSQYLSPDYTYYTGDTGAEDSRFVGSLTQGHMSEIEVARIDFASLTSSVTTSISVSSLSSVIPSSSALPPSSDSVNSALNVAFNHIAQAHVLDAPTYTVPIISGTDGISFDPPALPLLPPPPSPPFPQDEIERIASSIFSSLATLQCGLEALVSIIQSPQLACETLTIEVTPKVALSRNAALLADSESSDDVMASDTSINNTTILASTGLPNTTAANYSQTQLVLFAYLSSRQSLWHHLQAFMCDDSGYSTLNRVLNRNNHVTRNSGSVSTQSTEQPLALNISHRASLDERMAGTQLMTSLETIVRNSILCLYSWSLYLTSQLLPPHCHLPSSPKSATSSSTGTPLPSSYKQGIAECLSKRPPTALSYNTLSRLVSGIHQRAASPSPSRPSHFPSLLLYSSSLWHYLATCILHDERLSVRGVNDIHQLIVFVEPQPLNSESPSTQPMHPPNSRSSSDSSPAAVSTSTSSRAGYPISLPSPTVLCCMYPCRCTAGSASPPPQHLLLPIALVRDLDACVIFCLTEWMEMFLIKPDSGTPQAEWASYMSLSLNASLPPPNTSLTTSQHRAIWPHIVTMLQVHCSLHRYMPPHWHSHLIHLHSKALTALLSDMLKRITHEIISQSLQLYPTNQTQSGAGSIVSAVPCPLIQRCDYALNESSKGFLPSKYKDDTMSDSLHREGVEEAPHIGTSTNAGTNGNSTSNSSSSDPQLAVDTQRDCSSTAMSQPQYSLIGKLGETSQEVDAAELNSCHCSISNPRPESPWHMWHNTPSIPKGPKPSEPASSRPNHGSIDTEYMTSTLLHQIEAYHDPLPLERAQLVAVGIILINNMALLADTSSGSMTSSSSESTSSSPHSASSTASPSHPSSQRNPSGWNRVMAQQLSTLTRIIRLDIMNYAHQSCAYRLGKQPSSPINPNTSPSVSNNLRSPSPFAYTQPTVGRWLMCRTLLTHLIQSLHLITKQSWDLMAGCYWEASNEEQDETMGFNAHNNNATSNTTWTHSSSSSTQSTSTSSHPYRHPSLKGCLLLLQNTSRIFYYISDALQQHYFNTSQALPECISPVCCCLQADTLHPIHNPLTLLPLVSSYTAAQHTTASAQTQKHRQQQQQQTVQMKTWRQLSETVRSLQTSVLAMIHLLE